MRISDWSSDVCSSDLKHAQRDALLEARVREVGERGGAVGIAYLNTVGGQDGLVFDGASVLADADGHVHPAARAFESHWLVADFDADGGRSEEHTSELQSLMRISYAVFCLTKTTTRPHILVDISIAHTLPYTILYSIQ